MKKVIAMVLAAVLCVSMVACGAPKIEEKPASDGEKQLVIDSAKTALFSEEFQGYVKYFEDMTGSDSGNPEILNVFTFKHPDVEGMAMNLVLFNVKYNVGVEECAFDTVQFVVDQETGEVYDSVTYRNEQYTGELKDKHDAMIMFLHSGVLMDKNSNDYLWADNEESTRFTDADLKEINAAING
jgi:hypothetical protein